MARHYDNLATKARIAVLNMITAAQTSHIGSNLSCIDLLTVLFERTNLSEDKVLFSKGWASASAYYFLAEKGIIPKSALDTYCKPGSHLNGLLEPGVPGVHFAGGSVAMGIAAGIGFAFAKRISNEQGTIYVLESDGAMDTGITWEAALIGAHHKLANLVVIVDANGFQAMGKVDDVLNLEPLTGKWKAFGWDAIEIDGHNFSQIEKALSKRHPRPLVIIARTIKGKGISFMEHNNIYHYKRISPDEYERALEELHG
jgi:transketolase